MVWRLLSLVSSRLSYFVTKSVDNSLSEPHFTVKSKIERRDIMLAQEGRGFCKTIVIVLFLFAFANCGFLTSGLSFTFGSGSSAGGDTGGDSGSTTTLDVDLYEGAEADLFNDSTGSAQLPAPIAKIDGPDITKIIVSTESISSSISDTNFAVSPQYQVSATVAVTVTGAAGAVPNADFLFHLYNNTQGNSEICDVNADGSFSCVVLGDLGDAYMFFVSDADVTYVSAPTYLNITQTGVIALADTGSNAAVSATVIVDDSGYYYLLVVSDGVANLYRRTINGGVLQIVLQNSTIIPSIINALSENVILIYATDGLAYQITISGASSSQSLAVSSPLASPKFAISSTIAAIDLINDDIDSADPTTSKAYRIQIARNPDGSVDSVHFYWPNTVANVDALGGEFDVNIVTGIVGVSQIFRHFDLGAVTAVYGSGANQGVMIWEQEGLGGAMCSTDLCFARPTIEGENVEQEIPNALDAPDGFPEVVSELLTSSFDENLFYILSPTGFYQAGFYQYNDHNNLSNMAGGDYIPISVSLADDDTVILGCCPDGDDINGICILDRDAEEFVMIHTASSNLCTRNAPPSYKDGVIHFYDALGRHSTIQFSNNAAIAAYRSNPPMALGACDYNPSDAMAANFNAFCTCALDYTGYNDKTCNTLGNECRTADQDDDLGDCYYYLVSQYPTLSGIGDFEAGNVLDR